MGSSIIEERYAGIPEWRRYAKRVYYTLSGTAEEQSVVLCPDHRIQFYQYQPSAQERGEEFPLTECEICKQEVWFEMMVQKKSYYRRVIYMKRSIREATTEELIEALLERKGIEYIVIDKDEQCQIIVETHEKQLYKSTGRYGPETIIRYILPTGGS